MANTEGRITWPVDILGDIASVLGRNTGDLGELCGDTMDVDGIRHDANAVNPLAFWKPFRNSAKGFATVAAQKAAIIATGCGFGVNTASSATLPTYAPATGTTIPHAVWTYNKPRGLSYSEEFRITDFAPKEAGYGYYHGAVSPVYVMWPNGIKTSSVNTFLILLDGSGNAEYWKPNYCISFSDLFPNNSVYDSYRMAVVFKNSNGYVVAIGTQTMAQIRSVKAGWVNVDFQWISQLLPNIGDDVEVSVCLIQDTGYSTETTTYRINNYTGVVTSLEIKSGCDRTTLKYIGDGDITGMTGSATVTLGNKVTFAEQGFSCYYPIANIDINISSVNAANWGQLTAVNLRLTLQSDGQTMGLPGQPGAGNYEHVFNFALALSANQTKSYPSVFVQGVNGFESCAYVGSSANGKLKVTLEAIQGTTATQLYYTEITLTR